jgi:ubiquinone/menaquinone biosynthesis C-methylase UbiE
LREIGIRAGHVVLDFGCGSGTYTIPAAKLVGNGGRVYALDINSNFLDRMEERAKQGGLTNIVRIDASGEGEIPLENGVIDVILLIDVLHLIENREALFNEAYRILKRGGLLSVYPMHVAEKEVEELANRRNFTFEARRVQRRFLVFRRKLMDSETVFSNNKLRKEFGSPSGYHSSLFGIRNPFFRA